MLLPDGNPLESVSPDAPFSAFKFHWPRSKDNECGCSLPDAQLCSSLILILRDYRDAITREFFDRFRRRFAPVYADSGAIYSSNADVYGGSGECAEVVGVRHGLPVYAGWMDEEEALDKEMRAYLEGVRAFVNFEGPKHLIYFEDLLGFTPPFPSCASGLRF